MKTLHKQPYWVKQREIAGEVLPWVADKKAIMLLCSGWFTVTPQCSAPQSVYLRVKVICNHVSAILACVEFVIKSMVYNNNNT